MPCFTSPSWVGLQDAWAAHGQEDGTVSGVGRPQNPLPDGPVAAVSAELRRQREQARLTFRDLADDAGYSLTTVTAACSGRRLPSWEVTRAIVAACGGDEDAMRVLYDRACTATGRPVPEPDRAVTDPPDPGKIITAAQLVDGMRQLRTWAGSPSLAELNRRSGGHLPPSTVSGVLRRAGLPRRELVLRYASACRLPGPAVSEWENAWDRIKGAEDTADRAADGVHGSSEGQPDAGPAPPSTPPAASTIARAIAFLFKPFRLMSFVCLMELVCFVLAPAFARPSSAPAVPEQATVSATALTLGGLPAGTEVGLLNGPGHSLANCVSTHQEKRGRP